MDLLDKYKIKYNVVKTYSNGVRVGNVPSHKDPKKKEGTNQAWFPKSWTNKDIKRAGEHVAGLKGNRHVPDGKTIYGVITPDCSLAIGQSACLQQTNTYFNRAVRFYLQKNGIPVISNIRWSDESSFEYCFLGVPKHSIILVSTHGCIRSSEQKTMFKKGISAMLEELQPTDVLVHGYMPDSVFGKFLQDTKFHRYKSWFERTHEKAV